MREDDKFAQAHNYDGDCAIETAGLIGNLNLDWPIADTDYIKKSYFFSPYHSLLSLSMRALLLNISLEIKHWEYS